MQSKPPGYLTLSAAAEILGCAKLEVKALINSGKFRSKTAPFRSNLHDMDALKTYVNTQDVRDFLISSRLICTDSPLPDPEFLVLAAETFLEYAKSQVAK